MTLNPRSKLLILDQIESETKKIHGVINSPVFNPGHSSLIRHRQSTQIVLLDLARDHRAAGAAVIPSVHSSVQAATASIA